MLFDIQCLCRPTTNIVFINHKKSQTFSNKYNLNNKFNTRPKKLNLPKHFCKTQHTNPHGFKPSTDKHLINSKVHTIQKNNQDQKYVQYEYLFPKHLLGPSKQNELVLCACAQTSQGISLYCGSKLNFAKKQFFITG